MYDNLSARLRGEAKVSDASTYIKELMLQAADALDHFENVAKAFSLISIPAEEARYEQQE